RGRPRHLRTGPRGPAQAHHHADRRGRRAAGRDGGQFRPLVRGARPGAGTGERDQDDRGPSRAEARPRRRRPAIRGGAPGACTVNTKSRSTILITGANKGLGREAARRLAAEGHEVWAAARDPERGRAAAEEVRAHPVVLDVTDDESVRAAAATLT